MGLEAGDVMGVWHSACLVVLCSSLIAIAAAFVVSPATGPVIATRSKSASILVACAIGLAALTLAIGALDQVLVSAVISVAALFSAATAIQIWSSAASGARAVGKPEREEWDETRTALVTEIDEVRRKLRILSDLSGDWIWQTDESNNFTYISDGIRKVLGYGPENYVGRRAEKLLEVDPNQPTFESYDALVGERRPFRDYTFICKTAKGTLCTILVSGSPWFDAENVFRGYQGFACDFTSQKQLQEARAAARAKESFLASISHEIRTPLNGVIGILELLAQTKLDKDQSSLVSTASTSGDALLHLINEILDVSRISAGHFEMTTEPAQVAEVVRHCAASLRPLAAKSATTLHVSVAPNIPAFLMIDPKRYAQILSNLVGNAIKFTKQGRIDVELKWTTESPKMGRLITSVKDSGIGIPDDMQAEVFEEFSMLKDREGLNPNGTGLGLALCKKLTKLMGGDIGLTSEVGQGSTFWFDLRLAVAEDVETQGLAKALVSETAFAGVKLHILLAEDNMTNALVAKRMLESVGHVIRHVVDGAQAVEAASSQNFDLILMDVSMPVMDGTAATKQIRKREADRKDSPIPIVALSAHAGKTERAEMLAAGMTSCLSKPIRRDDLLHEVAKRGGRKSRPLPPSMLPQMQQTERVPPSQSPIPIDSHKLEAAQQPTAALASIVTPKVPAQTLDRAVLDTLAEETGVEALPALIELFIEEVSRRRQQLFAAQSSSSVKDLEKVCHAIAGGASTIGAIRLSKICKKLEKTCRANPDPKYFALVDVLDTEIDAVIGKLKGVKGGNVALQVSV